MEKMAGSDYSSVFKDHGVSGVTVGVVAALVPLLVSLILVGKRKVKQRGVPVEVGGEAGVAMRNARSAKLIEVPWEGATTLAALFEQSCKKHSRQRFLGTRKLIGREFIAASDGRKFEKLHLGEYQWETYGEVFDRACNFASGLVKLGHDVNTRAAIFSESRAEWLIAFQGCFRQNITVVTIYASLGEDALIHSLNETQVSTLICDSKQLKKLAAISSSLTHIQNVIYFEDDETGAESNLSRNTSTWTVNSFSEVEELGKRSPVHPRLPVSEDVAVVMYTSGSTGLPKGVMITQGNLVATSAAVMTVIPKLGRNDVYLAYLPLAHVLELAAESIMLSAGCAIGYGSALTLTDTSNKIKKGTKGDASELKPTLMVAVPAILDRVRDGVSTKVVEKGGFAKKLFNMGYKRCLASIEGSWLGAWGVEKLLWDAIVFKKIRSILGGNIRFILCGGAPLSGDTQRFINICMGAPIAQGYGLTETCAGAAFTEWDDTSVGRVGPPLCCCYIKLVSWEEGGYTTSDKPMPRGEVVVGGFSVTAGYFNNDAKTKEVYKVDERGIRWFYTGDIGQFHADGCVEIIDRKKDIVKLQHGEYISLGKVEAALMTSNYVDNVMVYADPFHNYCVALVVPSRHILEKWAKEAGMTYGDFPELCDKVEAIKEVQQSLLKSESKDGSVTLSPVNESEENSVENKELEVGSNVEEVADSQGITIRRRPSTGPPLHYVGPFEFRIQSEGNTPRNILEEIVWNKDVEVTQMKEKTPLARMKKWVENAPPVRNFVRALRTSNLRTGLPGLIAEVKKASPSRGVLRENFDPVEIAQAYEKGGAACISVLTDKKYFQGSFENLEAIRNAGVKCPLLCKEFVIDAWQIFYARSKGADAILLIAAVLPDADLKYMTKICKMLGMAALIEVHNEGEMDRVLGIDGVQLIGINNRDLETFELDISTTKKLLEGERGQLIRRKDIVVVGESGLFTPADIAYVQESGVKAVLVGESIVKKDDPAQGITELFGKDISL